MSGICSIHQSRPGPVEGCIPCHSTMEDLLGETTVAIMRAEAEAAGLFTCDCGFEYYKTVSACPLCRKERKIILS